MIPTMRAVTYVQLDILKPVLNLLAEIHSARFAAANSVVVRKFNLQRSELLIILLRSQIRNFVFKIIT